LLVVLLVVLLAASAARAAPAEQEPWPPGTVVSVEGTPHLFIADDSGLLHWAGDTRVLADHFVDWTSQAGVSPAQLRDLPRGDPWLSAGLLKDGDAIYLVKWETEEPQPALLHIQSIQDLELFGVDEDNYEQLVLDRQAWEDEFGVSVDDLARGELDPVVVTPPPAPPPPPPPSPPPTRVPAPPPRPAPAAGGGGGGGGGGGSAPAGPPSAPRVNPGPPAPAGNPGPPGIPGAFVDRFAGSDGAALTAHNPAWTTDGGDWLVAGGAARMRTAGISGGATVDVGRTDQDVAADVTLPAVTAPYPTDWFCGLFVRYSGPADNLRVRYLYQDNSPEVEVWDIASQRPGDLIALANLGPDALLPGSTHTLRVVVRGRSVTVFHDGAVVVQGQTSIATGTRAGIGVADNLPFGQPRWANFRAAPAS
jgi:hypothetical protein